MVLLVEVGLVVHVFVSFGTAVEIFVPRVIIVFYWAITDDF